jgi:hypothetical protein
MNAGMAELFGIVGVILLSLSGGSSAFAGAGSGVAHWEGLDGAGGAGNARFELTRSAELDSVDAIVRVDAGRFGFRLPDK